MRKTKKKSAKSIRAKAKAIAKAVAKAAAKAEAKAKFKEKPKDIDVFSVYLKKIDKTTILSKNKKDELDEDFDNTIK